MRAKRAKRAELQLTIYLKLSLSRHIRAGFGPLCGRVCWGGTHAPPWSSKWAELQAAGAPASSGPVTLHSTSCGCRGQALELALAASYAQKCGRCGGTVAAYRPLPLHWVAASHRLRRPSDANRRPRHSGCPLVVALLAGSRHVQGAPLPVSGCRI